MLIDPVQATASFQTGTTVSDGFFESETFSIVFFANTDNNNCSAFVQTISLDEVETRADKKECVTTPVLTTETPTTNPPTTDPPTTDPPTTDPPTTDPTTTYPPTTNPSTIDPSPGNSFQRTDKKGQNSEVQNGEAAVISKCLRNNINYSNPTSAAAAILIDPVQATASFQTGTTILDGSFTKFHLSFWCKFLGVIKVADKTDPKRFYLEVKLHRLNTASGLFEKDGRSIWGNATDYASIQSERWIEVRRSFFESETFSIVFFAHHNHNCSKFVQTIGLDEVETRADKKECVTTPVPTTEPPTTNPPTTDPPTTYPPTTNPSTIDPEYLQEIRSRLTCNFDGRQADPSPPGPAAFRLLPVCHEGPVVNGAPWINAAFYKYQFERTDKKGQANEVQNGAAAVISKCLRNNFNYNNPTSAAAAMLIDPVQATASLQTGTTISDESLTKFHLSFWCRLHGVIKVADKTDPNRFYLEVRLHRLTTSGQFEKHGRLIWGNATDYASIESDSWTEIRRSFIESESFSIVFFAHHNNNCSAFVQTIGLDEVETRAGN
ncbi:hypothetical protein BV898_17549 [Hypsibius exemplaris]|uniref:MAM domain-containing protein n=1 Tax=Hypsibius exemplaris TaxID=2072580 RepID=A0A9X6NI91_HYPEX|nr:hypothetical protein BV898_17549 [Hypsibius exemplaris]